MVERLKTLQNSLLKSVASKKGAILAHLWRKKHFSPVRTPCNAPAGTCGISLQNQWFLKKCQLLHTSGEGSVFRLFRTPKKAPQNTSEFPCKINAF